VKRLPIFILFFIPQPVFAARPLVTDDARITKPDSCQLESWIRTHANGNEFWALPACNPGGNLEVSVGTAYSKSHHQDESVDVIIQAKTIIKELKTNEWGVGFTIGTVQHSDDSTPGPNGIGSTYAYVPISVSSQNDKIITHVNLGYLHNILSVHDLLTWGLGSELRLSSSTNYVLEIYGNHKESPALQTGFRYSFLPDLIQIDVTVGRQFGEASANWLSIGIRYTPDRFY
jgi:hypothetical protein